MSWQPNPYALTLFISALISGSVAVYAWRRRPTTGATSVTVFMVAAAVWSLAYGLELISVELATKILWAKVQYFGIVAVAPMMLLIVLQYVGREQWLTRRNSILLAIIPIMILVLVWTNEVHGLIWQETWLVTDDSWFNLGLEHGPLFWIIVLYSYVCLLAGTLLLVQALRRSSGLYRAQTGIIVAGTLVPWAANALYVLDLSPFFGLDLTPFAFTITGLIATWGLFRFRLLDLMPIARAVVVEGMSDGIIVLDALGRIVDLNPAAERIIERSAASVIGQPADQVFLEQGELVEQYRDVHEAQAQITVGDDDEQRHYNLRISPLRDRRGKTTGRILALHDTTELRQTEVELRKQQKRVEEQNVTLRKLSQAVEQSANTVVITDLRGKIEYVNPKFEESTGYSAQEALSQNPSLLKSGQQDDAFYADLWQTITAGHEWHGDFLNKRKDGTLYWERATIAPIYDATGQMTHFVAVKEDITARVQAEEALQQHVAELQLRNEELDAFAHTVAHDLKNPVSVMVGYSDLLNRGYGKVPETLVREALETMARQGRKMSTIVDELLLLSSVREMKEIDIEPLEMNRIVAESVVDLRNVIEEYEGEILAPDDWPTALGYAPWIGVVWTNYISNALKYGGRPPQVELGATILEDGRVQFWVRDNGDGLSPDERALLFTPFERLHREGIKGHGLGLSIVRRILEKLDGDVGVESAGEPGLGSTFYFVLPAAALDTG